MKTTITGVITDIFPKETYGSFEKRRFWVLQQDAQYPNHWEVNAQGADIYLVDDYKPGEAVRVECFVTGRKWAKNGKEGVMVNLVGKSIERIGGAKQPAASTRQQTGGIPPTTTQEAPDDLPF